ncbi:hypothetical protein B0J12DRAFT_28520 [Macrophomina phaseolina]|uniref:Uncharacterized protein n=1 Tax=Macrophomina phaseolina TaxID=35725 RepID=A0ABQ8GY07_9PEZI|nr:hypothetical protein B0J12DRAFT_28520 [Macrophomina phaseolina]
MPWRPLNQRNPPSAIRSQSGPATPNLALYRISPITRSSDWPSISPLRARPSLRASASCEATTVASPSSSTRRTSIFACLARPVAGRLSGPTKMLRFSALRSAPMGHIKKHTKCPGNVLQGCWRARALRDMNQEGREGCRSAVCFLMFNRHEGVYVLWGGQSVKNGVFRWSCSKFYVCSWHFFPTCWGSALAMWKTRQCGQ